MSSLLIAGVSLVLMVIVLVNAYVSGYYEEMERRKRSR